MTPLVAKMWTRPPLRVVEGTGCSGVAGAVRRVVLSLPLPWASRMRDVRLRAVGRSKLSATKTCLPRVVMTTGPSSVVKTCSVPSDGGVVDAPAV